MKPPAGRAVGDRVPPRGGRRDPEELFRDLMGRGPDAGGLSGRDLADPGVTAVSGAAPRKNPGR